jgi:hypothetical protein
MLELDALRKQIDALKKNIDAKVKIRDGHRDEFRNETLGPKTLNDEQFSVLKCKVDNQSLAILKLRIELNRLRKEEGELEKKLVNIVPFSGGPATTPRHSPAA